MPLLSGFNSKVNINVTFGERLLSEFYDTSDNNIAGNISPSSGIVQPKSENVEIRNFAYHVRAQKTCGIKN